MKTLFSLLAVAALVLTSSFTIHEQQKLNEQRSTFNCFNYVRAHRQAKNVVLNWSVNDPSIVQFTIERSYDGEFFDPAGNAAFTGTGSYRFTDAGVFPGLIQYRVIAHKMDGTTECSPVTTVRIVSRG